MNVLTAPAFVCYAFEGHVVDTRTRELRDAGGAVLPLTSRGFDTLCVLLAHPDQLVTKEELLSSVWNGRVVEENNLTQAIAALRRAFGTDGQDHRFIVTVPGRGYRFVPQVRIVGGLDAEPAAHRGPALPGTPGWEGALVSPVAGQPAHRNWSAVSGARPPRIRRAGPWVSGAIALVLLLGAGWWTRTQPALPHPGVQPPTLAVLPFQSAGGDGSQALLELGLADTLVTRLARVESLRVHPLGSTRRAARASRDPLEVGRALGATWVVEGSAQTLGGRIRVNVRLLSVATAATLWSDTFDADGSEVFALQDRMAAAIARGLSRPAPAAAAATSPCDGQDVEAYRALLRAEFQLQRRGQTTLSAYRDAIGLDPTCVRAHAGLAVAQMFLTHDDKDPSEMFPLARAAVDRALALDPSSAAAWMARGRYLQLHAWDWTGAESALRRALALNPSLADAHFALAHLLVSTGRHREGLLHMRQARALDPFSPLYNALEGGFLTAAGNPREAQVRVAQALELEPGFWVAHLVKGGMALDRGDARAAVADLERAAEASRGNSQVLAVLALAHAAAGTPQRARAIREELRGRQRAGHYVPATSLAAVELAVGERHAAMAWLEQGRQRRDIRMAFLQQDARWNPLREEPAFRALSARMRLAGGAASGRY